MDRRPFSAASSLRRTLRLAAVGGLAASLTACALFTPPTAPHPSRLSRTPEPIVIPSEPPDEAPTLAPDPGDRAGFAAAANALAELASYRVALTTTGLVPSSSADGQVSMAATLVQGDNPAAQFRMDGVDGFEAGRLQGIVVGDEAWLKEGSRGWRASAGGPADFDAAYSALSPIDLASGFDGLDPALEVVGGETRNGQRTTHYRASSESPAAVDAGLIAGTADLWLADPGGYLVALDVAGTWDVEGTPTPVTLRIDVTHVGDRANVVKPPA
ncbi:MAG TPA: hypothetical protein VIK65_12900 [Candidatus Limnocylindrales bacterium]